MAETNQTNRSWHRTPPGIDKMLVAYLRGETVPVAAKDAATVVVLRDAGPASESGGGLEAFLLRRKTAMASAGGHYVFPGGLVDAADLAADLPWAGPEPREWATTLGCSAELARGLVCAAIRETFEECGLLLAGPSSDSLVHAMGDEWEAERRAVVRRDLAFAELLRRRGLVLRTDLMAGLARWITPEWAPRRYDTWFFVVGLPSGQCPRSMGEESDRGGWLAVRDAVRRYEDGTLALMLPTAQTLRELSEYDAVDDVLRAPLDCAPRRFRLVRGAAGSYVTFGPAGAEQFAYSVPRLFCS